MRRPLGAMALAAAMGFSLAAAAGEDDAFFAEDAGKWGTAMRIVEPGYPRPARLANITGYVDVEGIVTATGKLSEVTLTPDREESSIFIAPLEAVLGSWLFQAAVGADCMPRPHPARARVWFDLDENGPRIRVSHRPAEKPPQKMSVLHRERPRYPDGMLARNIEALVYARSEVAADGHVEKVAAQAYWEGRDSRRLRAFATEAAVALREFRYTPAPEGLERPRIACTTIFFRLRD